MSRDYQTKPVMYIDRFTEKVQQPDKVLISSLHRMLDIIPNDNLALGIDMVVAELLQFHNPNAPGDLIPPELLNMELPE